MQYTRIRSPFERNSTREVQLKMHAIEYTNLILEIQRESKTILAINIYIYIYICVCMYKYIYRPLSN